MPEDSFTRLMANLVVAYAVDFQSDSISGAAVEPAVWLEGFEGPLCSLPGTDRIWLEPVSGSASYEKVI